MSNDYGNAWMECPMAKLQFPKKLQCPMSKSACAASGPWVFVLKNYLDIGNWALGLRQSPLKTHYERPEIRLSPVAEEPRLRRRGRAHPRAGHRCEHGDLQRRQRRAAAASAIQGAGAARVRLREVEGHGLHVRVLSELPGLAAPAGRFQQPRGVPHGGMEPHRHQPTG